MKMKVNVFKECLEQLATRKYNKYYFYEWAVIHSFVSVELGKIFYEHSYFNETIYLSAH